MEKIYFHENNVKVSVIPRKNLKLFINLLFKKEKQKINRIHIIFCSDIYLLSLNKKFLNHNYFTDTLTFILSRENGISGEIYLSVGRIKENAKELSVPYSLELTRVIIHGCLHLCGYADHPKSSSIKLFTLQEKYLNRWIVSRETLIGE